ncbi:hypothetical protein M3148_06255 [Georgenia satyanarayanai]|uniref:hypothetical protein n=1 Tax=Georgenia satyanarayanai TaxID=860221 RepID=UPI00203D85E5|nr:hypothetical protein [Georgenia satyanarayanai]MCM3660597.1 hypothetical protein [Georgenia satyanarayanai]
MTRPTTALHRASAASAAVALALALGACGGEEEPADEPATTEDATAATAEAPTTEEASADEATEDEPAAHGLTVTAEGRGIILLTVTEGEAPGDAAPLEGKLISGPGGCLALQPGGQPELLLFAADAELLQAPPRVSVDGTETELGQALTLDATAVPLADVEGVPQQCSQGAAPSAWVVGD